MLKVQRKKLSLHPKVLSMTERYSSIDLSQTTQNNSKIIAKTNYENE